MPLYTVVGYYRDNSQRYCTTVEAESWQEAEDQVVADSGCAVVATFEGTLTPVDDETYCKEA